MRKLDLLLWEFKQSPVIKGSVKSVDSESGVFLVSMNGIEGEPPFTYTVNDTEVSVAEMNLSWAAGDAKANLTKYVGDLHKGADGVSKLWPEVID